MGCCLILVIGIVIWVIVQKNIEESERQAKERNYRINQAISNIQATLESILAKEKCMDDILDNLFIENRLSWEADCGIINQQILEIQDLFKRVRNINRDLDRDAPSQNMEYRIKVEESRILPKMEYAQKIVSDLEKMRNTMPTCKMMDENAYGKIDKNYWDSILAMNRQDAFSYIDECEQALVNKNLEKVILIDLEMVLKCAWFFATEKTFSVADFQKAKNVFSRIYRYSHIDFIIAELYAKKKMGGEDVLRDHVRNLSKLEWSAQTLTLIASALMWMNAYKTEHSVLEHMLATGKEMTAKTQERLHSLTNGGGKAPSGFEVTSSGKALYFDVSALAWKDEEYVGLFENLAFQDKTLNYSLAIRDDDKDLFIAQGINVPETTVVLGKFKDVFTEEYGSCVVAQQVSCTTLSGSGQEKMEGILVSSSECKQMSIFIHIARIGKKLIIKFYTLFMPTDADLATQKQQALSMYKKLSPSVTMWESSLKDTMLMAVEQLLNAGVSPENEGSEVVPGGGELVF